jgi:hypothetical protein
MMANSNKFNQATSGSGDPLSIPRPWNYSPGTPFVLDALRVTNALPDLPGGQPGLMSVRTLYTEGVKCEIDQWIDTFPIPGTNPDQLQIYINNVPYGTRIPFAKPLASLTWPYEFSISESDIGEHGVKNLRYEVFQATGGTDGPATPTVVTVDRVDPNARIIPAAVVLPTWVDEVLTMEDLAAHGDVLDLVIPGRLDPQVGDAVLLYWSLLDPVPIFSMSDLPRTTDPLNVPLTAATILARGAGQKLITYRYTDRAGNPTSWPADLRVLAVVTEPSATNLLPPRVPEAPLDLTDAQMGRAEVFIDGYDNARVGDDILISFNGLMISHTLTSVAWPQRVQIPWDVLREGGLEAAYTADVFYRVVRDGAASASSDTITVNVDLRSAGGRPEDPGPVNPTLDLIVVESSEGLIDEIGEGDTGPATGRFDVYDGAAVGHRIQIYWDGVPALTPAHTVTAADLLLPQFELTIPASVIAAQGNGVKPVWYSLNNGLNDNIIDSLETPVQVNAFVLEDLEPVVFPDALPIGGGLFVITCDQRIFDGIRTVIYDSVNLQAGDSVILHWVVYGPDDLNSTTIVVDHTFPPVVVTNNHNTPGHPGELLTVAFTPFIQPVTTGRIEARYRVIKVDGATTGESDPTVVYMNRRTAGGTICG